MSKISVRECPLVMRKAFLNQHDSYSIRWLEPLNEEPEPNLSDEEQDAKYGNEPNEYSVILDVYCGNGDLQNNRYYSSWKGVERAIKRLRKKIKS